MLDKYIIIDIRNMDYFKSDGKVVLFDTEEEACDTAGIYEFENCWIAKLTYNHIEAEVLTYAQMNL